MGAIIYGLCALTALACAYFLLLAYWRGRYRLLLWSGLCFVGLTINNFLLFLDKLVFTRVDLSLARNVEALLSMSILIYGLVWDAQ